MLDFLAFLGGHFRILREKQLMFDFEYEIASSIAISFYFTLPTTLYIPHAFLL